MLTKAQSIVHYDFGRRSVHPDRLSRKTHAHYLALAGRMLTIYRQGTGSVRAQLHGQIRRLLQDVEDCPTRRIDAFCKLLDDACEYDKDASRQAAKLRGRVFGLAAPKHPLVGQADELFDHDALLTKEQIASTLKLSWAEIEGRLFADVIEFHRLLTPPPDELDAAALLSRYNVAQTQAALYSAVSMTVWAKEDFKAILRFAKLARLMHSIQRRGDEYIFRFSGAAAVVRGTKRYGVHFAKFLTGLLAAKNWRMQATIQGPGNQRFSLRLTCKDGLRSGVTVDEFDSQTEQSFADRWLKQETRGWQLTRETTILHEGQSVFIPDFSLRHRDYGEVLLEIIGFWTPEYLQSKASTLAQFRDSAPLLLAIAASQHEMIPKLGLPHVLYKKELDVNSVLELLEQHFEPLPDAPITTQHAPP
ncbi:MAG: DUF790 family protein [Planctomycetaceae bacterium]